MSSSLASVRSSWPWYRSVNDSRWMSRDCFLLVERERKRKRKRTNETTSAKKKGKKKENERPTKKAAVGRGDRRQRRRKRKKNARANVGLGFCIHDSKHSPVPSPDISDAAGVQNYDRKAHPRRVLAKHCWRRRRKNNAPPIDSFDVDVDDFTAPHFLSALATPRDPLAPSL